MAKYARILIKNVMITMMIVIVKSLKSSDDYYDKVSDDDNHITFNMMLLYCDNNIRLRQYNSTMVCDDVECYIMFWTDFF